MTLSFLDVGCVSICQLAHLIEQKLQAEHSFTYDHTESRKGGLEIVEMLNVASICNRHGYWTFSNL